MHKVLLKKVRVSFPNLHEAKGFNGSEPKYSATYIFGHKHPCVAEINKAVTECAKEKWGAKADATLKTIIASGKSVLHDGDTKDYDGYEGMLFVNASSKKRPTVVDSDGSTALVADDNKPYGGCYVNAYIDIWAMDNEYGKRICAALGGVQFHSHGEAFGSGGTPDTFTAIEDEEESLV